MAHAIDTIGTATTAPITPAPITPSTTLPAITEIATATGCSRTAQPITSGCMTWPSICPITTISTNTMIAVTTPRPASATTVATAIATGEPTSGTNEATNSSTVNGSASGTWSRYSAMPTMTALVPATMI